MLQGWSVVAARGGRVRHSELVTELGFFTPEGWQVQLDNVEVHEDWVFASFAPMTTEDEVVHSPRADMCACRSDSSSLPDGREDVADAAPTSLRAPGSGVTCHALAAARRRLVGVASAASGPSPLLLWWVSAL